MDVWEIKQKIDTDKKIKRIIQKHPEMLVKIEIRGQKNDY